MQQGMVFSSLIVTSWPMVKLYYIQYPVDRIDMQQWEGSQFSTRAIMNIRYTIG